MTNKLFMPPPEKLHDLEGERLQLKRCLLLDDDKVFSEIVCEFLREQGFEMAVARNGVEGLKKVMAGAFDVIVCDLMMPHLPGDMFYLAVQRVKPSLCQRFVFVTGSVGDPKFRAFLRQTGCLALWKPFQLHELASAIETVLRKAERK
jgi:DNA-binding response OmpR family regulator